MRSIIQNIDGAAVVGEVSDDTAAYMVERGYAQYVTDEPSAEATSADEKPSKGSRRPSRSQSRTSAPSDAPKVSKTVSDADASQPESSAL